MINKLIKLINLKTIITLALTGVFSFLTVTGKVSPESFLSIFTVVIGFYFGHQSNKKGSEE